MPATGPAAFPDPPPAGPSRRKLTPARRLLAALGVPVGDALVRLWWSTCRVTAVVDGHHLVAAAATGPVIPVYWHAHQLFCVRHLLRGGVPGLATGFLISPSVDGEIPARLAGRHGARVIRGSSSHTGLRALRDYYAALQQGVSPAITPDGPHGPRRVCKPGAVLLSQLSGRPVIPLACHARHAWRLRTWDRFVLPVPFSRITVAVGEPLQVPKGLDAGALAAWQGRLAAALDAAHALAASAAR